MGFGIKCGCVDGGHNCAGSYNSLPDKEKVIFISMAQSRTIWKDTELRSERSESPGSRIEDFFYAVVLVRLLFFDHFLEHSSSAVFC